MTNPAHTPIALDEKGLEAAARAKANQFAGLGLNAESEISNADGAKFALWQVELEDAAEIIRAYLSAVGGEAGAGPSLPDRWRLVPPEATDAMWEAARNQKSFAASYRAMIAASPQPANPWQTRAEAAEAELARLKAQPGVVKALEELAQRIEADGTASQIGSAEEIREILSALAAPVSQEPVAWGYWEKLPGRNGKTVLRFVRTRDQADDLKENGIDVFPLYASPQSITEGEPSDAQMKRLSRFAELERKVAVAKEALLECKRLNGMDRPVSCSDVVEIALASLEDR